MGIVVTVAMLLGLIVLMPQIHRRIKSNQAVFIAWFLFLAGLWNALWFGLGNLQLFWGQAALVSGLAMMIVAVFILNRFTNSEMFLNKWIISAYTLLEPLKGLSIAILLINFVLYSVTLVRLNLGMSILN